MDFQMLNTVFHTDFNLDSIASVRQNWNAETRYNRMEIPRPRHAFLLLTDYSAVFQLPGEHILQGYPGDIILLPKGARYVLSFLVPPERQTHPIVVNFRLTDKEGLEPSLGSGVIRLCTDDGSFSPIFHAAAQLYKSAAPALLKAKLYELFGTLFPITEKDECCLDYINRNYTERFHIPLLAQRCAMSETGYRKRFKELTGFSPIQYINRLKIEKACQLILSEDFSMQDISDFLNFYNLPYFYKVFRGITGMTPMQYRQNSTSGT